ncbi:MAG: isoprenylcysteine carboxylmethyltransferase family protein [Syntrophobacteraceae bacterium]|nr:isoprenylcysteine carboxylmethyltransferase family protein [Syntrophobacteraceae bacterium]
MNLLDAGKNSKIRIVHSRVLAAVVLLLLIVCENRPGSGLSQALISFAGLGCVIVASFGRTWSSLYITGRKTTTLVESGPYSTTRNPLYLFSLFGAAGIGLASGSFLILALLTLSFGLYYPFVILGEEESLRKIHGPSFEAYAKRVPRFIPKIWIYTEPETSSVNTRQLRKAILDASYFLWIYGAVQLIERLHAAKVLPTLLRLP